MRAIIHTPTGDLTQSLDFYNKLNFNVLSEEPLLLVTDGKAIIEINPDRYARAGVKCFKTSWSKEVEALSKLTAVVKIEKGYLLSDPNGVWIYLIEEDLEAGEVSIEMEAPCFGVTGNFAGVSIECTDIAATVAIWEAIGFSKSMGELEQGWVVYSNEEGMGISLMKPLMCPHMFFNPSLTYFNGKKNNPAIIEKIRALQIPITEEITHFNQEGIVDNIIIRDPGGYGFFIFND